MSQVLDHVVGSPSQSANGVGTWSGQHMGVVAPGKEDTDSNSWLHLHSGLILHSQMAPLNDQPGWMDYSSHGSWDQSGGLSVHHSAWDPEVWSDLDKLIMALLLAGSPLFW